MIAIPSIAFGGFSGSAKDVTARQRDGRNILTVRSWPTGQATNAQMVRRASVSKITKTYQLLTGEQMQAWERLAEHTSGKSVFGQKAEMSGINLFVRLNVSRVMAGEGILKDAPEKVFSLPSVSYASIWITPTTVILKGIVREPGLKLVVKMSGGQSSGVSNGWSRAVVITPGIVDDWGDADLTYLYFKTIGIMPGVGEKIFLEMYWLDPASGFVGPSVFDSRLVETEEGAVEGGLVKREQITLADLKKKSHLSECDLDFSTNAPVVFFDAICCGHSNVASSYAYLEEPIPEECLGSSMVLGRGKGGESGKITAQSYAVQIINDKWDGPHIQFGHRGGSYVKPTEVFGPGILY
ncbi:MAG: hypothetical protein K6F47_11515 [Bacteroidaceae bacterium]|nr:hypothetical protein [Bacteroidaceae bacterium]